MLFHCEMLIHYFFFFFLFFFFFFQFAFIFLLQATAKIPNKRECSFLKIFVFFFFSTDCYQHIPLFREIFLAYHRPLIFCSVQRKLRLREAVALLARRTFKKLFSYLDRSLVPFLFVGNKQPVFGQAHKTMFQFTLLFVKQSVC